MKRFFAASIALAFAVVACNDMGTEPIALSPDALTDLGIASTTIYWEGHGSEHIDGCTAGYHWIFAPGGGLDGAPQFFSSIAADNNVPMFRMSESAGDNAAWHYNSGLVDTEEGVTPHVVVSGDIHPQAKLIISHCREADQENLTVSKTVVTTFDREHDWSIDKRVETEKEHEKDGDPKIWLYTDGSGDEEATWHVDVTYEGFTDSDWNVSGQIFIVNTGDLPATITDVKDELDGTDITVTCPVTFPHDLAVDATLVCTYSEDGYVTGNNVATVTTERDTYSDTQAIVWGDPDSEAHRYVNVTDTNPGLAEKYTAAELTLDAHDYDDGDEIPFEYSEDFAYADYADCDGETILNTARVIGDDNEILDYATATLKVNVQCFVWESAWAMGVGDDVEAEAFCDNGFSNWGWSNEIGQPYEGTWPVYAGAGQCDIGKGTLVGYFEVTYNGGFSYEFNILDGFETEGEAVYADTEMFPTTRNGRDTTAPGQYYIGDDLSGDIHVIAHINVGEPDPDFGPQD